MDTGPPGSGAPFSPSAASSSAASFRPQRPAAAAAAKLIGSMSPEATKAAREKAAALAANEKAARAAARAAAAAAPSPPPSTGKRKPPPSVASEDGAAEAMVEKSDEGRPAKTAKRMTVEDFMKLDNVGLAQAIWGDAAFRRWQEDNKTFSKTKKDKDGNPVVKYPQARKIFELSGPTTQCENVIGKLKDSEFKDGKWTGTPCYICGGAIVKNAPELGNNLEDLSGLFGQCEHVLAVAQAVLLYQLYNDSDKSELNKEAAVRVFFQQEYKWAHTICNLEKSNNPLIIIEQGVFKLNEEGVNSLLNSISVSTRESAELLRSLLKINDLQATVRWKNRRKIAIEETLRKIIADLNAKFAKAPKTMLLTAAANVVGRVREEFQTKTPSGHHLTEEEKALNDPDESAQNPVSPEILELRRKAALEILGLPPDQLNREPPPIDMLGFEDIAGAHALLGLRQGGKRRKTHRMRRCRLPKLL